MLSETISTWWGCELAAPSRASPAASSTGRAGWSGGAKHPTPGLSWKGISSFYKLFHKFSGALALYILMKILSRWIARAVRSSWCHLFVRLSPQSMTNYDCRIAVYARSAKECNKVSPQHICHFSAISYIFDTTIEHDNDYMMNWPYFCIQTLSKSTITCSLQKCQMSIEHKVDLLAKYWG